MARATSFATLFLVILAVLSSVQANATGGSSSKTPGTGATTPIAGSTDTYMFELLMLVNQHRSSLGLKPLCLTAGLINSAIIHSQDMANKQYMDHAGSDGSTPFTRMEKAGYVGFGYAAENIAYGSLGGQLKFETAAAVFKTWIESKGHRENIELPQVNQMGAGRAQGTCVGGRGTCAYWTQNFGQNDVNIYKCLTPSGTTTTVTPNPPSQPSQPPQQPSQPPQQPSQPPQQPSQPPQQPTASPTPQPPRTRTRITYTHQPVPTTVITTPPRQPDQPGYPGQKPPVATSSSATAIVTATATATAVPTPPSDESPRNSTPVADPPMSTTTADVPVAPPTATATAIPTVTAPANPGYPSQPQPPVPTTPIAPEPTTPVNPQPSTPTTPQPQPPTGGDSQTPGKPTPTRRPRRKCKCTCEGADGKKTSYTTGY